MAEKLANASYLETPIIVKEHIVEGLKIAQNGGDSSLSKAFSGSGVLFKVIDSQSFLQFSSTSSELPSKVVEGIAVEIIGTAAVTST